MFLLLLEERFDWWCGLFFSTVVGEFDLLFALPLFGSVLLITAVRILVASLVS